MNSKTKSELLAKLKAMKSYPAPEEIAGILTTVVALLPDELFADAERKLEPAQQPAQQPEKKAEGEQAFTPPAAPAQP